MQVSSRWWQFAACCFPFLFIPFAGANATTSEAVPPASFDCARAVGIDTDIICSDPLLRRADSDLGKLYRALIAEADGQARIDALKGDERVWILRRNSQCNVSKSLKLNPDELPGYVDCFLSAYEERMDDLRRMRADPRVDPTAISNPIRKSSFGDSTAEIAIPNGALSETGVLAADNSSSILGFRSDNSLVILGSKPGQSDPSVYVWKAGQIKENLTSATPLPAASALCVTSKETLVLPSATEPAALVALQGKLQKTATASLTPEVRRACSMSADRRQVGSADGIYALDLGPRVASSTDSSRFVTVLDGQGSHNLNPPIRIDRRFPPSAQFNPSENKFVVTQGARPQDARTIADRDWAKTNCGAFSVVDPVTKRTTTSCIPFGSYVDETSDAVPVPLPTHAGLYFAIASRGLFKVVDNVAERLVAAPVSQVKIAADGCSIGFLGSPGKNSPLRRVMVLNACAL